MFIWWCQCQGDDTQVEERIEIVREFPQTGAKQSTSMSIKVTWLEWPLHISVI